MRTIFITVENKAPVEYPVGTIASELLEKNFSDTNGLPYLGAMVNNKVTSLSYPIPVNCNIRFLTMEDSNGWRIYRNSLCFLLAKTVNDLHPEAVLSVEHSFGLGLYCIFKPSPDRKEGILPEQVLAIEKRMREFQEHEIPIERRKMAFTEAIEYFHNSGQTDKLNILRFRNPPHVVIHDCGGFSDLAHGPLVPSTGILDKFRLIPYQAGFVLHLPDRTDPNIIPDFQDQPHLFEIFKEHKEWGRILGVSTAGELNETIINKRISSFIRTAEALHEKKLGEIAARITSKKDKLRVILVAGPSSSGKTTFAKRISTHLSVNGLNVVTVATDDYFVGKDRNPVDEDGNPDYEHIEAVDLDLFNQHLLALIHGEKVRIPRFNFTTKEREETEKEISVAADEIILIEGIHGLNPRLTELVPHENKFKIYVSALTQLSLDSNNRISTTDNRLIRRIIRDYQFRGHLPLETFRLWPSVRRGEKRWIFPFQREADATFNSALDYELAVLKPMVEPLLMQIKPSDTEYAESQRISEFLLNFLQTSPDHVPDNSILREYIGGSCFEY